MLSIGQIESLLVPATKAKTNALVRTWDDDGKEVLIQSQVRASDFGKFHGRAGTIKRSRKGVSTRMPNGSRYYLHGEGTDVVAYKV